MAEALWITLIGMGLVFAAILALWGLMALLVWATALREKRPAPSESLAEVAPAAPEGDSSAAEAAAAASAASAAAAAVAVALAMTGEPRHGDGGNQVGAWQAVQRAGQLDQNMAVSRKRVLR